MLIEQDSILDNDNCIITFIVSHFRHYYEANQNMHNYHRLFLVSQERYDRLVNLAGSGGAASLKDETEFGDSVFSESEGGPAGKIRSGSEALSGGQVSEAEDSTVIDNG